MPLGAHGPARTGEGDLLIIGGAEDKLGKRTVLNEFVRRAGGADARIAVIPTASSLGPEIIDVYAALFHKLGAAEVYGVRPEDRAQASSPELVKELDRATGIFMTGGNQLKLSTVVAGTPFADAIVEARARGAVIGGTSAGASIQSSHMVAFGPGGSTPKQRMTQVAAGLGLVENCVIDQHFAQRNRYGRLLMIVAQSPQLLGIGVDEDTCAVITRESDDEVAGQVLRVIGRGSVTILDPANIVSNASTRSFTNPAYGASILPPGVTASACGRLVRARSIISSSLARAVAMSGATSAVSGMLCQYFLGISFSIAFTLRRAGLKMLA